MIGYHQWMKFWRSYRLRQIAKPADPTPDEVEVIRRGVGMFGPGIPF